MYDMYTVYVFFWRGNHLYNSWKLYNHDYLKKEAISSFIIHHCRVLAEPNVHVVSYFILAYLNAFRHSDA